MRRLTWRSPILLLVALAATASGSLAGQQAAVAKSKAPKCKSGQMLVRVGKKPVCKRTSVLLPTPQAGDERVAFVKYALAPATLQVKGRRARHVRTFWSFGKRAQKARAQILRLLPKVLAQVDAARAQVATAALTRPRARAAACAAPEKPSTYTSKDGGATMSATMDANGMSIGFDGTTSGGISIHFIYITDAGCGAMKVPACPQANGEVTAQQTKADDVTVEITQGGKVLSFTRVKGTRVTSAKGQNAGDAKLDWVQIDDDMSSSVSVQGKGFGRTTFSGDFRRTAVWDMRADKWLQDRFVPKITGDIQIDESVGTYSAMVHGIVAAFRAAQDGTPSGPGWSNPASKCITIDWTPASDTIKVKKGTAGTVTGTLDASTGGAATDGITKVTGQSNGTFSPTEIRARLPDIGYSVTGSSGVMSVTVEATSTAGAGSGEWHQPIERSDSPDRISGPFSGQYQNGSLLETWSGTATWKRAPNLDEGNTTRRYYLESANYTVVVSGSTGGSPDCRADGGGTFAFGPQPTQPSFTIFNPASDVVFPGGDWVLPFTYTWAIYPPPGEADYTWTAHCPLPAGDETQTASVSDLVTLHDATTADGVTFNGSNNPSAGRGETWSFSGSG